MPFLCALGSHSWQGCTCTRCHTKRDAEHAWQDCKCSTCGQVKDSGHVWEGCKCKRCDRTQDADHSWVGCTCTTCGRSRDTAHDWSADLQCTKCGRSQFADVRYKGTEVTSGSTYKVYTAPGRARALEFLRACVVNEERYYLIIETPQGNFGKDLVVIFDERTSARIEFGERRPLPSPVKSPDRCARCGYPVLPFDASAPGADALSPFEKLLQSTPKDGAQPVVFLEGLKDKGLGFFCPACPTAWCAFCVSEENLRCGLCGGTLRLCREMAVAAGRDV